MTITLYISDEAPAQPDELAELRRQTEALAAELREMRRERGFWS